MPTKEELANTEKPSNQIERTAESFEERLKNIRENAKQNEGLFSFRKQREKQIEQYTNEESKIKTNVAEAKPEIKQENMSVEPKTEKIGNPLNTSDILLQLKQMKEKMEEEIKNTSTLKEEKEDYKLENLENDVNGKIDNNEDTNANDKLNENNNDNSEEKVNIKTGNNEENTNKEEQENANSKQEENISEEKNGTIDDANAIIENIDDPEIQKEFEEIKGKMQDLNDNPQVVSEDFNEMYAKLFGRVPIQEETENKEQEESTTDAVDIIKDNISVFEGQEEAKKPAYKFIGIVFKTYIILEIDKEMYILDQHAAHERIMYEKVKKNYYSEGSKDSQMLLLPDVITYIYENSFEGCSSLKDINCGKLICLKKDIPLFKCTHDEIMNIIKNSEEIQISLKSREKANYHESLNTYKNDEEEIQKNEKIEEVLEKLDEINKSIKESSKDKGYSGNSLNYNTIEDIIDGIWSIL